jgi:hypothetical protein
MRIADETIAEALVASRFVYKRWTLSGIAPIWINGERAFGSERNPAPLLNTLRGWLAFRSSRPDPLVEQRFDSIWQWLAEQDTPLRTRRLSELHEAARPALEQIVQAAGELKRNSDGPSLVAASKLLHAWNPRLFVIIDKYAMGDFVFRHRWLKDDLERSCGVLNSPVLQLTDYSSVLIWAGALMRANPAIMSIYELLIEELRAKESAPPACVEYEAVAFEWLVEGLVELPPAGVTLENGGT